MAWIIIMAATRMGTGWSGVAACAICIPCAVRITRVATRWLTGAIGCDSTVITIWKTFRVGTCPGVRSRTTC